MFKKLSIVCAVILASAITHAENMYYSDAVLAQIDDQVITSFEVKQYAEKQEAALRQQFKGQELVDKIVALRKQVLDTLPDYTRRIFTACYVERQSYAEVAQLMNISTSTVKKYISRALQQIAEMRNRSTKTA